MYTVWTRESRGSVIETVCGGGAAGENRVLSGRLAAVRTTRRHASCTARISDTREKKKEKKLVFRLLHSCNVGGTRVFGYFFFAPSSGTQKHDRRTGHVQHRVYSYTSSAALSTRIIYTIRLCRNVALCRAKPRSETLLHYRERFSSARVSPRTCVLFRGFSTEISFSTREIRDSTGGPRVSYNNDRCTSTVQFTQMRILLLPRLRLHFGGRPPSSHRPFRSSRSSAARPARTPPAAAAAALETVSPKTKTR